METRERFQDSNKIWNASWNKLSKEKTEQKSMLNKETNVILECYKGHSFKNFTSKNVQYENDRENRVVLKAGKTKDNCHNEAYERWLQIKSQTKRNFFLRLVIICNLEISHVVQLFWPQIKKRGTLSARGAARRLGIRMSVRGASQSQSRPVIGWRRVVSHHTIAGA